jgi:hypothetical protein
MEVEDVVSSDPTTEDQAYMDDDEDGYYDEDEAREDDEPSAWAVKEELRRLLLTKNPSPATDLVCQTRSHRGKLHFSQSLRSLSILNFDHIRGRYGEDDRLCFHPIWREVNHLHKRKVPEGRQ